MKVKTKYETYNNCYLTVNKYVADDSLAVGIWNAEDGPIASLTVCLPNGIANETLAYIDTNNCPWALDFIKEYNLGENLGITARSGYCEYPLVAFDMEIINKYVR